MGLKSIVVAGGIWMAVTILVSFFIAATMGGRGAEVVFLFSVLPGLVGWAVHIVYLKAAKNISSFPTTQPLGVAIATLLTVSIVVTVVGNPSPIYAAAAMIFGFGFVPALLAGYLAHWALLKTIQKAKNA